MAVHVIDTSLAVVKVQHMSTVYNPDTKQVEVFIYTENDNILRWDESVETWYRIVSKDQMPRYGA